MGLEEFSSDTNTDNGGKNKDKSYIPKCHSCDTEGRHIVHVQYKCPNDDCKVISWYEH